MILEKTISTGCKRMAKNPRIMVAYTPMDHDKIKIMGSKAKVESMQKIGEIEEAEKRKMQAKVNKILAFKPDVFIKTAYLQLPRAASCLGWRHCDRTRRLRRS